MRNDTSFTMQPKVLLSHHVQVHEIKSKQSVQGWLQYGCVLGDILKKPSV